MEVVGSHIDEMRVAAMSLENNSIPGCLVGASFSTDWHGEPIRKRYSWESFLGLLLGYQSTGWFSRGTFDQLRLHVRVRFLSLISGDAARALVQSEIKLLERLKKKSDGEGTRLESDSDGQDHVDKGLSSIGASNFTSKTNHESQLLFGKV
eukprot:Gb_12851 [translate_table: standard]